jgi:zinc protease
VDKVEALSPTDLQTAATQLIHPDALTWVIVGDLATIEAPIRKLSIGEVKVLDADGNVLR